MNGFIKRSDITNVLPNGILEMGEFTPDSSGLAVYMSGCYTVGEIKAILEDLIHVDKQYQAQQKLIKAQQQLLNAKSW